MRMVTIVISALVVVMITLQLAMTIDREPAVIAKETWEYTIQYDDTLWSIVKKHYPKSDIRQVIWDIRELNPGLQPALLRPGQRIKMPIKELV